jgi:2-keto-3-deoxy-L-rhamnonate aldolase RhmA
MSTPRHQRRLLRAAHAEHDGPALGTWGTLPATEVVEIFAHAGFHQTMLNNDAGLLGGAARLAVEPAVNGAADTASRAGSAGGREWLTHA